MLESVFVADLQEEELGSAFVLESGFVADSLEEEQLAFTVMLGSLRQATTRMAFGYVGFLYVAWTPGVL